jgi:PPP family 3-phenylpropionic acid transporter
MLAILAAFSFFWNAVLPQFEVTTLDHLGDGVHHYSRVRLWGSVGFILSAVALGPLLARFGIQWLPAILLALLTAIWMNTLSVKEHDGPRHPDHAGMVTTLRRPAVISLLVACFLLQASHGPYYAFFSIYMEDHGYKAGAVGWLWALGVIAEIGVFVRMSAWLPRYGARALLLAATAMAVVRWLLTAALAGCLPAMLIAQVMHAGSFGLYHGASIYLIYQLFPGRLQGRGQALYSSMSFGLGGAVGSLVSGYVWTTVGASWAFVGAAVAAAAGALVVWGGVRPQTPHMSLKTTTDELRLPSA